MADHCKNLENCFHTNSGNDTGDEHLLEKFPFEIPVTIVELIMAVIILFGNGLVIAAYISDRKLRTVSNFFLVNLVIADLIVGITIPISTAIYYVPADSMSKWFCILQFSVIAIPLGSSTLCLLLITVERYLSVVYPFHHQQIFTKGRRHTLVAMAWILTILIMGIIPFSLLHNSSLRITSKTDCDLLSVIPPKYWAYIVLPIAYLLFGSVIVVYIKILIVARQQIKSIELLVVQVSSCDKKNMQNVRLARTGFILLGLFILFWLPFTILLSATVYGNLKDNQILTIVRIAAMLFPPASSAINPAIYAARIRRFKIRIKKMLNLTISSSDKYDTYEIRQSFKVSRTKAAEKPTEPAYSFDSGVGGSNDYNPENASTKSSQTSDQLKLSPLGSNREIVETEHVSPIQIQIENKKPHQSRRFSINYPAMQHIINEENGIPFSSTANPKLKSPQPHNRGIYASKLNSLSKVSSSKEIRSQSIACIETEGLALNAKKPGGGRMSLTARNSISAICAEPIVIDCDNKSEYLRLVVKRTVRDCSDSEPEDEQRDSVVNIAFNKSLKRSKRFLKNKPRPHATDEEAINNPVGHSLDVVVPTAPEILPIVTQTLATPNGSLAGTLERTKITKIHHQRSASGISSSSVGMTIDNDDMQFEITNTNRGSRRMSRFKNFNQNSLQRHQKKQMKPGEPEDQYFNQLSSSQKDKAAPSLHFVRGIWDGTLRRLRKSASKPKVLVMNRGGEKHGSSRDKLNQHLSRSLSDVSQQEVKVVHQRSRSALDPSEAYTGSQDLVSMETTFKAPPKDHKSGSGAGRFAIVTTMKSSATPALSNKHLPAGLKCPDKMDSTDDISLSENADDYIETDTHQAAEHTAGNPANKLTGKQLGPTTKEHLTSNSSCNSTSQQMVQEQGSLPSTTIQSDYNTNTTLLCKCLKPNCMRKVNADTANSVMLPVKVRLPDGKEQDLLLTNQDIYSNQYRFRRRQKSTDASAYPSQNSYYAV